MVGEKGTSKRRAVGYCRTSGEGQRDNTSIPRQKAEIEEFIERNGWQFVRHYVDESLSGAKVDGRVNFQKMIKDAAKERFDLVVIYDISRFARDGSDIIGTTTSLKKNFGVHTIDTKSAFDTRKPRNVLLNFTLAGVSEAERLSILDRTINGRADTARQGLPWNGKPPAGRRFNKDSGKWVVTDQGRQLKKLLIRYVNGEGLEPLAKEYGKGFCPATITRNIRNGNLAGTYHAKFNPKEIEIEDKNRVIAVPQIPQVITPQLQRRVQDHMKHNQTWNKGNKQKYQLAGFAYCSHCGKPLKGQTVKGFVYYRHYGRDGSGCPYRGIRGELLEKQVLDYLYNFFTDAPAYDKAIKDALPNDDDRKALQNDIKKVDRQLAQISNEVMRLVDAIVKGADANLLVDKQDGLKAERLALENRRNDLKETLVGMPDPKQVEREAEVLRILLCEKHRHKDWRTIPFEDVHKFLHFLFSDNPRKTGFGVFVGKVKGNWKITFKGCVNFYHTVVAGQPVGREGDKVLGAIKREMRLAREEYKEALEEAEACEDFLRPNKVLKYL